MAGIGNLNIDASISTCKQYRLPRSFSVSKAVGQGLLNEPVERDLYRHRRPTRRFIYRHFNALTGFALVISHCTLDYLFRGKRT